MSKKGGYIIIDFAEKPLSSTPATIPGIYNKVEGNKGKALLLSGLVFNDVEKPDAFATFKIISSNIVFKAYGYDITITDDDEVSIASHVEGSVVSVSATGTATDEVGYITIDGVEKKLAGGGGGGGATTFYKVGSDLNTKPDGSGQWVTQSIFDEAFAKGPVYIFDGGFYENAVLTKMDYEGVYAIYYFDVTSDDKFSTVSIY